MSGLSTVSDSSTPVAQMRAKDTTSMPTSVTASAHHMASTLAAAHPPDSAGRGMTWPSNPHGVHMMAVASHTLWRVQLGPRPCMSEGARSGALSPRLASKVSVMPWVR